MTQRWVSKANFNIPDGFERRDVSDFQRYSGILVLTSSGDKKKGITVISRARDISSDAAAIANATEKEITLAVVDGKTNNAGKIKVNEMDAWRFEVEGKNKGIFGQKYTYMVTVIEGDKEYVVINSWSLTDNFDKEKEEFKKISDSVSGIKEVNTTAAVIVPAIGITPTQAIVEAPLNKEASVTPKEVLANEVTKTQGDSASKKLIDLHKLFKDGVINQNDFETKKQELLKTM